MRLLRVAVRRLLSFELTGHYYSISQQPIFGLVSEKSSANVGIGPTRLSASAG
jgi:hypothetical protein